MSHESIGGSEAGIKPDKVTSNHLKKFDFVFHFLRASEGNSWRFRTEAIAWLWIMSDHKK